MAAPGTFQSYGSVTNDGEKGRLSGRNPVTAGKAGVDPQAAMLPSDNTCSEDPWPEASGRKTLLTFCCD